MLHEMGIETSVNLEKLIECARLAQELVGRPLDSHVAKSGVVNHGGGGSGRG
jgi:hydroxymethylglutaryl-CoA lyase